MYTFYIHLLHFITLETKASPINTNSYTHKHILRGKREIYNPQAEKMNKNNRRKKNKIKYKTEITTM